MKIKNKALVIAGVFLFVKYYRVKIIKILLIKLYKYDIITPLYAYGGVK